MHIFVTGAAGYIGGSVAARLMADGRRANGLVRSDERAARVEAQVEAQGIGPVIGPLDDGAVLATAARPRR